MEGRPRTSPVEDRVLVHGRSIGECQMLKSDIYLSLRVWHSTSITNFPRENLLSEAFSLTILSLTFLILRELFTLSLSSTLSLVRSQPWSSPLYWVPPLHLLLHHIHSSLIFLHIPKIIPQCLGQISHSACSQSPWSSSIKLENVTENDHTFHWPNIQDANENFIAGHVKNVSLTTAPFNSLPVLQYTSVSRNHGHVSTLTTPTPS